MRKFQYKNLFIYSSLQFAGHVEEYFVENTGKLIVFIVMPRLKNKYNLLRIYEKGILKKEKKVRSSSQIFLYYFLWWWYQQYFSLKYFSRKESFILFGCHPVCFFGMSIMKLMRRCSYANFIGDYFPGENFIIRGFESVKQHYHDVIPYNFYLSDGINSIFNKGKVINTKTKKTIMWGANPKKIVKKLSQKKFQILFVGLIKESQGLEVLFSFLKNHKDSHVSIIGLCDDVLYKNYQAIIKSYGIQKQVYFPNKFFSDNELEKLSSTCHVGIALYDIDKSNPTYYTDPGKVKAYAELNLPIIMSNTSAVAEYVKKFKAGEVIERDEKTLQRALLRIKTHYPIYKKGLIEFNRYFYYKDYYKEKFDCFIQ